MFLQAKEQQSPARCRFVQSWGNRVGVLIRSSPKGRLSIILSLWSQKSCQKAMAPLTGKSNRWASTQPFSNSRNTAETVLDKRKKPRTHTHLKWYTCCFVFLFNMVDFKILKPLSFLLSLVLWSINKFKLRSLKKRCHHCWTKGTNACGSASVYRLIKATQLKNLWGNFGIWESDEISTVPRVFFSIWNVLKDFKIFQNICTWRCNSWP